MQSCPKKSKEKEVHYFEGNAVLQVGCYLMFGEIDRFESGSFLFFTFKLGGRLYKLKDGLWVSQIKRLHILELERLFKKRLVYC